VDYADSWSATVSAPRKTDFAEPPTEAFRQIVFPWE